MSESSAAAEQAKEQWSAEASALRKSLDAACAAYNALEDEFKNLCFGTQKSHSGNARELICPYSVQSEEVQGLVQALQEAREMSVNQKEQLSDMKNKEREFADIVDGLTTVVKEQKRRISELSEKRRRAASDHAASLLSFQCTYVEGQRTQPPDGQQTQLVSDLSACPQSAVRALQENVRAQQQKRKVEETERAEAMEILQSEVTAKEEIIAKLRNELPVALEKMINESKATIDECLRREAKLEENLAEQLSVSQELQDEVGLNGPFAFAECALVLLTHAVRLQLSEKALAKLERQNYQIREERDHLHALVADVSKKLKERSDSIKLIEEEVPHPEGTRGGKCVGEGAFSCFALRHVWFSPGPALLDSRRTLINFTRASKVARVKAVFKAKEERLIADGERARRRQKGRKQTGFAARVLPQKEHRPGFTLAPETACRGARARPGTVILTLAGSRGRP
ncbi:MAG: hypothetical protein BJ554DRAFT_7415 [Olpidium bornovanus]|uniref:Uncharacterized protein n=1 Tax=Olpidium bornovanus TaxID=278681 RepID=A0A8H7ZW05_9FUNG|nr:MAG: hypothetical protein BJ554DRAFT_7415 [Olpidium bornovanus]